MLATGTAAISVRNVVDVERGIRSVNGQTAASLVGMGFAQELPQWGRALELTDKGRAALTSNT